MSPRHSNTDIGWIRRELNAIKKQLRESNAAKRLQAATIGKGGLTVKDGGMIGVLYPNGKRGVSIGPMTDPNPGATFGKPIGSQIEMRKEDGEQVMFGLYRVIPGLSTAFPTGADIAQLSADSATIIGRESLILGDINGSTIIFDPTVGILLSTSLGTRITHNTTGASANCFIDPSDGRIWRAASSLRYKQDVEDATVDPAAVLRLQGRTWRDKGEVTENAETERRYIGFIAEELDEIGMGEFVVYDSEGRPDAIAYDRLSVALVAVLKDQETRISALEEAGDRLH